MSSIAYKPPAQELRLDFRHSPSTWQTLLGLPDDWHKPLVDDQGTLLLDYPGPHAGYGTTVALGIDTEPLVRLRQELHSPRVPIVTTERSSAGVSLHQEIFSVVDAPQSTSPRVVAMASELKGGKGHCPVLTVNSTDPLTVDPQSGWVLKNGQPFLSTRPPVERVETTPTGLRLVFAADVKRVEVLAAQGSSPPYTAPQIDDVAAEKARAIAFWSSSKLPWDRIHVPDTNVQALLEASARNIYQARERINGVPEYRTGPTQYRNIFVVDGAFILEVATWLGDRDNVRKAIDHIMSFQQDDGQVVVMNRTYLKETGIMLWALFRHAQLTQDKEWLQAHWQQVEKAVAWMTTTRQSTARDPTSPYAGLMPPGFTDGGIDGVRAEYSNTYWSLSGYKAAIDAARWLGKTDQAAAWQHEYETFTTAFKNAAARDAKTSPSGDTYLPTLMDFDPKDSPQKGQWSFCQTIFPGKVFSPDDPLMNGTLRMLDASSSEGLVLNTGWMDQGVWTYFGSFYAHAHLWLGHTKKAQEILYAFGNHASPMLAWVEEQMPRGKGDGVWGDMPHNWASAEFIRLVRHLIALERGNELHLLEGVPDSWLVPGADLSLKKMASEFGTLSFSLKISEDGKDATLDLGALGRDGEPGGPLIHLHGLKRLGFKGPDGKPLPDVIRGRWGEAMALRLSRGSH